MAYVFPNIQWMPIPNIGDEVIAYITSWQLDGLILTGGNDVGDAKIRDDTESCVISYAIEKDLPIFGVCRGLQMIQHYYDGPISICDKIRHVANTHTVSFIKPLTNVIKPDSQVDVNSYHTQAVSVDDLVSTLEPFAISEDGWVEGIYHRKNKITAVQWHPERNHPYAEADIDLMRSALDIRG
jgi:putative glutamine amidotransferase